MTRMILAGMIASHFAIHIWTVAWGGRTSLNHDEMWGATSSNLSVLDSILFVLRFDIHPPLYYLQLNIWAKISHSDLWLQVNSMVWLAGAALLVFSIVRSRHGAAVGVISASVVLSHPLLMDYATLVRMYTFVPFLAALGLWFADAIARDCDGSARADWYWVGLFASLAALTTSYALGGVAAGAILVYLLARLGGLRIKPMDLRKFLWVGAGVVAVLLLVAANSAIRAVAHAVAPTPSDVASTLSTLLVGVPIEGLGAGSGVLLFLFTALVVAALVTSAPARLLIGCLVVMPMVAVGLASFLLKPIWLTRTFIFCIPFIAVAIGDGISRLMKLPPCRDSSLFRAVSLCGVIGIVCGLALLGAARSAAPKAPNYVALADFAERNLGAGDCIAALNPFDVFWGLARYTEGANWSGGLRVQQEPTRRWKTIVSKMSPEVARRLKFVGETDRIVTRKGFVLAPGLPADFATSCGRVFAADYEAQFHEDLPQAGQAPLFAASGPISIRGPITLPVQ